MRKLLIIVFLFCSFSSFAQNPEELQNSYNYKRGTELLSAETPDYREAETSFLKELQEHPKNGYAYYCLAFIYDKYDKEGLALENIDKAIALLNKDKSWISYAYRLRASVNLQLDHEDLALADWEASLKANNDDYRTLIDRAEYYYKNDIYDLADADYDRMIAIQPGNPIAYLGKARNAVGQKRYQDAINTLDYCLKLDPSSSQAYAFRAEAYFGLKKYAEASDDIITSLGIDSNEKAFYLMYDYTGPEKDVLLAKMRIKEAKEPNNMRWPYFQGFILERNEEFQKAISAYEKSNNIESAASTLHRIAECYAELGQYLPALDYITKACNMDSTNIDLFIDKGDFFYEMGDSKKAIEEFDDLISKSPERALLYYRRGFFKNYSHDIDGAIEDYTTAILLDASYIYSYLGRGKCYHIKGNEAAAVADYNKAISMDTVYGEDNVAMYAYLALGQKDKAIAFEDSVLSYSKSKGNLYDAACLYCRMGDTDKSLSYLRQCLEKGFRRFAHIKNDDDLTGLKDKAEFKTLMKEYEDKTERETEETITRLYGDSLEVSDVAADASEVTEVPFTRESGVCKVKCEINGLPLSFYFDSGASKVTLSSVEASFMIKNGFLKPSDVMGSSHYKDANGNISVGTDIMLRKVTFGGLELNNVRASVVNNQSAPLLLGQSVLSRLGKVEIDNVKGVIRVTK